MRQFRLLLIFDVAVQSPRGLLVWAYWNRCHALKECAPPDFDVEMCALDQFDMRTMAPKYDLIYCADYSAAFALFSQRPQGCRTPVVISFNKDSRSHQKFWAFTPRYATWTICNNADRFLTGGPQSRTSYIPNGVSDFWRPFPHSPRPRRVLWTGSSTIRKGKNYQAILQPLEAMLKDRGEEVSFRPINDLKTDFVFTREEQREWANSGDVVVMASSTEGGGPSFAMECAACGCIPIGTDVGNFKEWAGPIGVVCSPEIEPNPTWFLNAINLARSEIKQARVLAGMQRWLYSGPSGIGNWFYALFRRLINDGPERLSPFDWRERHFLDI